MVFLKDNHSIQIESLKDDKKRHRLWKENTLLYQDDFKIVGYNAYTSVEQWDGRSFTTQTPALFYFEKNCWFNVVYIIDETNPYYYCNLSSPFQFDNHKIYYIDYDIDVIVQADFSYEILDQEEFDRHAMKYHYSTEVKEAIQAGKKELIQRINSRNQPFNPAFIKYWQNQMTNVKNRQ